MDPQAGINMNPFNAHPQKQGISYTAHLGFAMGIAIRLSRSVIAFAAHAIFPFIDIRSDYDLEATSCFLRERNLWIEGKKQDQQMADHAVPQPGLFHQ
jgi:hypothetical protein